MQGNGTVLALVGMGTLIYGSMYVYYIRANAHRGDGEEDHKIVGKSEEDIADMGDDSPRFVYVT